MIHATAFGGNNTAGPIDVATARNACASASASGRMDFETETFLVQPAHSLRGEGFDASEDGTGRGTPLVPVAFSCKDYGADAGEVAPTLRSMGHDGSHANAGGQVTVAWAIGSHAGAADGETTNRSHANGGPVGSNISEELSYSLRAGRTQSVATTMQIRRLTPRECERLQGFPDDYLDIPYRGKPAADGPKYKALGNSWAVPVIRWVGERIQEAA